MVVCRKDAEAIAARAAGVNDAMDGLDKAHEDADAEMKKVWAEIEEAKQEMAKVFFDI